MCPAADILRWNTVNANYEFSFFAIDHLANEIVRVAKRRDSGDANSRTAADLYFCVDGLACSFHVTFPCIDRLKLRRTLT